MRDGELSEGLVPAHPRTYAGPLNHKGCGVRGRLLGDARYQSPLRPAVNRDGTFQKATTMYSQPLTGACRGTSIIAPPIVRIFRGQQADHPAPRRTESYPGYSTFGSGNSLDTLPSLTPAISRLRCNPCNQRTEPRPVRFGTVVNARVNVTGL